VIPTVSDLGQPPGALLRTLVAHRFWCVSAREAAAHDTPNGSSGSELRRCVGVLCLRPAPRAVTSAFLASVPSLSSHPGDPDFTPSRRVVVIDPRDERRALTARMVERCPPLNVVGLASNLNEAEPQIRAERADVVILEIQMPVTQGLATISALREQFPDLRIVVCSFHDDAATRESARMRGADGYLTKPIQIDDLLGLIFVPARSTADADHADPRTWTAHGT